ncbi:MAG: four helix bundle protein [Parcubacteria group bacterium]
MTFNVAPPREAPKVLLKEKDIYRFWITLHRDFPKVERFGVGQKIENSFLDLLELTFASVYLASEQKIVMLSRSITKLDNLKFFMQLAWESKLIPTEKYAKTSGDLEEVGRMLGGWRKGLIDKQKTPTKL